MTLSTQTEDNIMVLPRVLDRTVPTIDYACGLEL